MVLERRHGIPLDQNPGAESDGPSHPAKRRVENEDSTTNRPCKRIHHCEGHSSLKTYQIRTFICVEIPVHSQTHRIGSSSCQVRNTTGQTLGANTSTSDNRNPKPVESNSRLRTYTSLKDDQIDEIGTHIHRDLEDPSGKDSILSIKTEKSTRPQTPLETIDHVDEDKSDPRKKGRPQNALRKSRCSVTPPKTRSRRPIRSVRRVIARSESEDTGDELSFIKNDDKSEMEFIHPVLGLSEDTQDDIYPGSPDSQLDPLSESQPCLNSDNKSGCWEPYNKPKNARACRIPRSKITASEPTRRIIGPDFSLPPLSDVNQIFTDITRKALSLENGLSKTLQALKEKVLRVATMCSGTESPLLSLILVNKSLRALGHPEIRFAHQFSAEIEPFKQAYIDRNFHVPLLFRDVVEMARNKCTHATTAYGASAEIPGDLDLLVVGFSCVDYSNLNNYKKSLEEMGQSGATFKAVLTYAKLRKPSMILIENVEGAEWDKIRECFTSIGYAARHTKVDTKLYYLPQTRCRGYMFCIDVSLLAGSSADRVLEKWSSLMEYFRRRASASFSNFLLPEHDHRIRKAQWERGESSGNVIMWEACQGRHETERAGERLGRKRELLRWVDGGGCQPPEYADYSWLSKMPERVWDLMEILNLKCAARHGFDFQYKSQVCDLSQNPDRINKVCPSGLISCITPRGLPYISHKGRCLTGYELLSLQGIPIDQISLSHENDEELKDLAGNAMSSTVVGAAILSALIVSSEALEPTRESRPDFCSGGQTTVLEGSDSEYPLTLVKMDCVEGGVGSSKKELTRADTFVMLADARASARMCYCEGHGEIAQNQVQRCVLCEHTTCIRCGKRPKHEYTLLEVSERMPVYQFRRKWSSWFPARITMKVTGNPFPRRRDGFTNRFLSAVEQACAEGLVLAEFHRSLHWTVRYESLRAKVLVVLNKDPEIRWHIKPDQSLPGNDALRKLLETWPIARISFPDGIVGINASPNTLPSDQTQQDGSGSWKCLWPVPERHSIIIESSGVMVPSARSRIGLEDFRQETQPSQLIIRTDYDKFLSSAEKISGLYKLLTECGTAFNSLYVKEGVASGSGGPTERIFFFLECSLLGDGSNDYYVFSKQHSRLDLGDIRPIIARLDTRWRPWLPGLIPVIDMPGRWIPTREYKLIKSRSIVRAKMISQPGLAAAQLRDCRSRICVASFTVVPDSQGQARSAEPYECSLSDDTFTRSYGWCFLAKRLPSFDKWWPLEIEGFVRCETCVPPRPSITWQSNRSKTNHGVAPVEDPREAGRYEQKTKKLPQKLTARVESGNGGEETVMVAISIPMMAHQALTQLRCQTLAKPLERGRFVDQTLAWKLDANYIPVSNQRLPEFRLLKNQSDNPYGTPQGFKLPLRTDQQRSLTWMLRQEAGGGVQIPVQEIVEECAPKVGWRVECRARATVAVKGGVIADQVSYGKTITTLALIHVDWLDNGFDRWKITAGLLGASSSGLIPIAATLVVCPRHLTSQWRSEVSKFLPDSNYSQDGAVVEVSTMSALTKLRISTLEEAKIIIVSRDILAQDAYLEELIRLTGLSKPASRSQRAFREYYTYLMEALRWSTRRSGGENNGDAKLKDYDDHMSSILNRIPPGLLLEKKTPCVKNQARVSKENLLPVFQIFKFHRLVVDEFSYLDERYKINKSSILVQLQSIESDRVWLLSGTPPLADFNDINLMARLMGFSLGADHFTPAELKYRQRTKTELFMAFKDVKSDAWHAERHYQAQCFLDLLVRQNEARLDDPIDGVKCHNFLMPVQLDSAHRAIYLELAQHLNLIDMKMKKSLEASDRADRLNKSLVGCESAEETLLRCCACFERGCTLEQILNSRHEQLRSVKQEISRMLTQAEGWKKTLGEKDVHYSEWKKSVRVNSVGDRDITDEFLTMFKQTERSSGRAETGRGRGSDEMVKKLRVLVVSLRVLTKEYAMRARSYRFLRNLQAMQLDRRSEITSRLREGQPVHTGVAGVKEEQAETGAGFEGHHRPVARRKSRTRCANPECGRPEPGVDLMRVLSYCGHMVCGRCYKSKMNSDSCMIPGCAAHSQENAVVKAGDLEEDSPGQPDQLWEGSRGRSHGGPRESFGRKLDEIAALISGLAEDEKALLFVSSFKILDQVAALLEYYGISFSMVHGAGSSTFYQGSHGAHTQVKTGGATESIEQFINLTKRVKVLVLNQMDESAAGVNLTMANHVIFLSPSLSPTQQIYEASMRQSIGRARRYGQRKVVYVYHFAALKTIDVDILEKRERRVEVLHQLPKSRTAREQMEIQGKCKYMPNERLEEGAAPCKVVRWWGVRGKGERERPHVVETSLVPRSILLSCPCPEESSTDRGKIGATLGEKLGLSLTEKYWRFFPDPEPFTSLIKFSAAFRD